MKIRTMTATFGKLQRQTLELKDGLNIIEAPNESGKSTWCAFLRAMLYGIDTKARDKKGVIAEKNLYQPWSGAPMEGALRLDWKGRDITLRRTGKAGSPLSQFQAVFTGTEEPVEGISGDNVGETLIGVGREAFERCAFVGQNAVAVTGSAELERRISAIVSSGQEDVSYSETEQRLRDWKNRRYSNQKNGLIPRLQEERAALTALLDRLDAAHKQESAALAAIRELQQEAAALESQAAAHRAAANAQARQRYDAAKADVDRAQAELDAVLQEKQRRGKPPDQTVLRAMQGELTYLNTLDANIRQARREAEQAEPIPTVISHPVFSGMKPVDVWEKARADSVTVSSKDKNKTPWVVCLVLLLVLAAGALTAGLLLSVLLPLVGSAMLLAAAVILLLRRRKANARIKVILDTYGVTYGAAIEEQAKEYVRHWEEAEQARTEAALRAATLERLETEREELTARLLEQTRAFAPEVTDLYGVSAAVSLALNLDEKERTATLRLESAQAILTAVSAQGIPEPAEPPEHLPTLTATEVSVRLQQVQNELSLQNKALAMAQGEINTLGDRAALQARLGKLEEELARRKEEYEAILAAMDVLKEANTRLQERMSPALNKRAGELFHLLTGGEYDQVSLTREFEALAAKQNDVTPRRLLTLSRGTADQLYLAVRLAVCDLVLPGEDPAPLILDDALVYFDDKRLALALDLLRELGQKRQILLFTCQNRERLYLDGLPGVHVTGLQS